MFLHQSKLLKKNICKVKYGKIYANNDKMFKNANNHLFYYLVCSNYSLNPISFDIHKQIDFWHIEFVTK